MIFQHFKTKYELLSKEPKDLNKNVTQFVEENIKFDIKIKNNNNLEWPSNGRTKLINDKASDIKFNDIPLNNLKFGQVQDISINLNITKINPGNKKCIFHVNVDGKNYGNPLVLNVNVQKGEDERVLEFRKEYCLSINDFPTDILLKALEKVNFDKAKAFGSLFQ